MVQYDTESSQIENLTDQPDHFAKFFRPTQVKANHQMRCYHS